MSARLPRNTLRWLYAGLWIIVGALFLGIRIISFHRMGQSIYGRHVLLDSEWYHDQALRVSHGHFQEKLAYFFGPGWPVLLGAFYALTGTDSIAAGRVLNTILSGITLVCLAWSGKQIGGKWLALWVAVAWSLYGLSALYEQTLLLETSAACMLAILMSVWLLACKRIENAPAPLSLVRVVIIGAGIGAAAGFAALFRANVLAVLPVLVLMFAWLVHRKGEIPKTRRALHALAAAGAVFLGAIVAIAPATWHNYRAEGVLIPISSNFGINLWVGLGPAATGRYVMPPSTNNNTDPRGGVAVRQEVDRDLNSAELSAYWTRKTLPTLTLSRVVLLTWTKLRLLFQLRETPQIYTPDQMENENLTTRLPFLKGAHYMTFIFLGIALLIARRNPRDGAVGLGAAALLLSLLPFFVTDRYKLAASPWFLLVSLTGVTDLIMMFATGAWKQGVVMSLWILPGCIGWLWPIPLPDVNLLYAKQRASLQAEEGDYEPALRAIREYNIMQLDAPSLSLEASILEQYKHDYAAAADLYERAVPLMPLSATLHFNAAQAELRANRKDAAMTNLKEALKLDRGLPASAWYNLALLQREKGEREDARTSVQNAATAEPENALYRKLFEDLGRK